MYLQKDLNIFWANVWISEEAVGLAADGESEPRNTDSIQVVQPEGVMQNLLSCIFRWKRVKNIQTYKKNLYRPNIY